MNIKWLNYDLTPKNSRVAVNTNTRWKCSEADRLRADNIFKCWKLQDGSLNYLRLLCCNNQYGFWCGRKALQRKKFQLKTTSMDYCSVTSTMMTLSMTLIINGQCLSWGFNCIFPYINGTEHSPNILDCGWFSICLRGEEALQMGVGLLFEIQQSSEVWNLLKNDR